MTKKNTAKKKVGKAVKQEKGEKFLDYLKRMPLGQLKKETKLEYDYLMSDDACVSTGSMMMLEARLRELENRGVEFSENSKLSFQA